MMDLSGWALRNKHLVWFLVVALAVFGIVSVGNMSKLEDPEIKVKNALVVTTYPGASAHEVELEVTDVLEKRIRTMKGLRYVKSQSYSDLSIISVVLEQTVPDDEVEQHYDMLRRKVSDAVLPAGASRPVVRDDFGDLYGMFFALTGDGMDEARLTDYAEMVKRELLGVDGMERVELYGSRPQCINISLHEDRMANLGVGTAEVLMILQGQNAVVYPGYYENGTGRYRVRMSDKFKDTRDIAAMLIQGHDGSQLRLGDIATVEKDFATPSLSYGELIIDFTSPSELVGNMDEIQEYVQNHYPDAYVKLKRYNLMYKQYPIEVKFTGPDPAVLHRLSDSARAIMEQSGAVMQITSDWAPQVPVVTIDYNQTSARRSGLSRSDVGMSVLAATEGVPVGFFYDGIHRENVNVRIRTAEGEPILDLAQTQVFPTSPSLGTLLSEENLLKLRAGKLSSDELTQQMLGSTPLSQVANVKVEWEDPVVMRYNGQRIQTVQCSPLPGHEVAATRNHLAEKIDQIPLPDGYTRTWLGEYEANGDAMKYLFATYPIALLLIISILIILFKDYRKPLIILCTVPVVLTGVVAGILVSGKAFGFVALAGTLGLIGIIIKNSIVLMDEINLQLSQGVPPLKALVDGSQSRLRAVMMAALTTILGMIPLLPDPMFGPLAASIMGGLAYGTIITLVFVPVLYSLFFHIKIKPSEQ